MATPAPSGETTLLQHEDIKAMEVQLNRQWTLSPDSQADEHKYGYSIPGLRSRTGLVPRITPQVTVTSLPRGVTDVTSRLPPGKGNARVRRGSASSSITGLHRPALPAPALFVFASRWIRAVINLRRVQFFLLFLFHVWNVCRIYCFRLWGSNVDPQAVTHSCRNAFF